MFSWADKFKNYPNIITLFIYKIRLKKHDIKRVFKYITHKLSYPF